MLERLRAWFKPNQLRIANEKRLLQEAVREAGGNRKMAMAVVSLFYEKKSLANNCKTPHNIAVRVERDVQTHLHCQPRDATCEADLSKGQVVCFAKDAL